MLWKLNEAKNFHGNFHDMLERVVGVEMKCHITFFREQIRLQVSVFDLGISTSRGRVSILLGSRGKSGNLLEDQETSGKFKIFWKKSEKSKKNFYPCKFLTLKKIIENARRNVYS